MMGDETRAAPLGRPHRTARRRRCPTRALSACVAIAIAIGAGSASAQPAAAQAEPGSARRPEIRGLHPIDYAVTGAFGLGAMIELLLPVGMDRKRSGGILFDDTVRDAVVLHDADDRAVVARFSDVMLATLAIYPFAVDAGITAWGIRENPEIAWQMAVIDAEAFAFTSLTTGVIKRIVDRERPIGTECRKDPSYDPTCAASGQNYSFLSGHSSMTFTGAGLICIHHAELSLLGRDGDVLSCVTAITAASMTGMSRIAADKHYATDVLAGATLGLFSGAVMPYLLYYLPRQSPTEHGFAGGILAPVIGTSMLGATYSRAF